MPGPVRRIGIGIEKDPEKVLESANRVSGKFEIICYCSPGIVDRNAAGRGVSISEHANP